MVPSVRPHSGSTRAGSAGRARLDHAGTWLLDAGLVGGVGLCFLIDVAVGSGGYDTGPLNLLSAASVAAATQRRRPLPAVVGLALLALAATWARFAVGQNGFPQVAPVVALGGLAVPVARRAPAVDAAVAVVLAGLAAVALASWVRGDGMGIVAVLWGGVVLVGASSGVYLRLLDRRARVAEEAARSDERAELARELHDLVAHHVTAIVVQAQAATVVSGRDPDAAVAALGRIEHAGRDALVSMRRLVGALRAGGDEAAPTAPPVGLAGLDDLVATTTAAGVPVELRVDPAARSGVADAVAASAVRIVREALTNVLRHADSATAVEVDVRREGGTLVVVVTDDGRPQPAPRQDHRGFGLVGMAERAALLGGTLSAGPVPPPAHGWQVRAVLPADGGGAAATPGGGP